MKRVLVLAAMLAPCAAYAGEAMSALAAVGTPADGLPLEIGSARELSAAETPLQGGPLDAWRGHIWVSAKFGVLLQDSVAGGDAELIQAVEGKKGDRYYVFGSYRPGESGQRNVVLYRTTCELGAMIGEKCADPALVAYEATDDGRLLSAWSGGKNLRTSDPTVQSDFIALRALWLSDYRALYAETMTQAALDQIFGQGVVKARR